MPKILFHSYRGNPWEFDIVSRRIAPAEPSGPGKAHQATDGRFFGDMRGVSREEFDDQINNHAEILILNVTDRCNLRCKYCVFSGAYCGQRVHGSATMSLDTAMRGIDQFIARTGKTLQNPEKKLSIGFYGGEPLLAFDLIREVLDRVHGAEYSQLAGRLTHSITTNGTLLDEEKVEVLVKYGVSMQVSLDGPQELHDRNRVWPDGSGTFGAVVRNLEGACQRFPDFFASFAYVVTMFAPLRYLQRAAFFDSHPLFQGHQFRVTSVATANCDLAFDTSEEEKDRVEFAALLRQFHGRAVQRDTAGAAFESGLVSQNLARFRQAQGETGTATLGPNGCCIPGQRRILLSTAGRYHLCDKVTQNERLSLGDVNSGVCADRAWKIYNDYLALSRDDCLSCPLGNICSYCPASALEGDYMGVSSKRFQCASNLPYTRQLLEVYASIMEDVPQEDLDRWIAPRLT